jgi:hypothetical protein
MESLKKILIKNLTKKIETKERIELEFDRKKPSKE